MYINLRELVRLSRRDMDYIGTARKYHEDIERIVAETLRTLSSAGRRPGCRRGCAWCCRLVVNATAPEGELAAGYIDANLREEDKGALIEKIKRWLVWYGQGRYSTKRVECPFLASELCSIYHVRPMGCRVHYSGDADACRRGLEDPSFFYEPPLMEEVFDAAKPLCMEYRWKLEAQGVCFDDCVKPLPELVLKYLVKG
jgi:hypothetical protein